MYILRTGSPSLDTYELLAGDHPCREIYFRKLRWLADFAKHITQSYHHQDSVKAGSEARSSNGTF